MQEFTVEAWETAAGAVEAKLINERGDVQAHFTEAEADGLRSARYYLLVDEPHQHRIEAAHTGLYLTRIVNFGAETQYTDFTDPRGVKSHHEKTSNFEMFLGDYRQSDLIALTPVSERDDHKLKDLARRAEAEAGDSHPKNPNDGTAPIQP